MDILPPDWLRECAEAGQVIPPRPRHRLYLSRCTVEELEGAMDDFGDEHDVDVNLEDVAALIRGRRATDALESAAGRAAAEEGVDDIRQQAAAVSAAAAEAAANAVEEGEKSGGAVSKEALRIFSGCVFLVVAMPAEDGGRVGGGDAAADAAAATVPSSTFPGTEPPMYSFPAMELISRNAAGASAVVAADAAMGESRRLARGMELSLRLRGGIIAREPSARVTHVVAVTPSGGPSSTASSTLTAAPAAAAAVTPPSPAVSERALARALRTLAPPPPPKKKQNERSITEAFLAGGDLNLNLKGSGSGLDAAADGSREKVEQGKREGEEGLLFAGGLLRRSVHVVSPAWVMARIAAGQPVAAVDG